MTPCIISYLIQIHQLKDLNMYLYLYFLDIKHSSPILLKIIFVLNCCIFFFIFSDLVKFVMCTQVSKDCVPFCNCIEGHVYPGFQGTHDKLDQIIFFLIKIQKCQLSHHSKKKLVSWSHFLVFNFLQSQIITYFSFIKTSNQILMTKIP